MNDDRDYLEEALRIVRGDSLLLPQVEHLQALNDSRVYWRTAVLDKRAKVEAERERHEHLLSLGVAS